jgi:hypothetical protein
MRGPAPRREQSRRLHAYETSSAFVRREAYTASRCSRVPNPEIGNSGTPLTQGQQSRMGFSNNPGRDKGVMDGFRPGEGAGFILLVREAVARQDGRVPLVRMGVDPVLSS